MIDVGQRLNTSIISFKTPPPHPPLRTNCNAWKSYFYSFCCAFVSRFCFCHFPCSFPQVSSQNPTASWVVQNTPRPKVSAHRNTETHRKTHNLTSLPRVAHPTVVSRSLPSLGEMRGFSPLPPVPISRGFDDSSSWQISPKWTSHPLTLMQDELPNEQFDCRDSETIPSWQICSSRCEDVKEFVRSTTETCKHKQSAAGNHILILFFVRSHTWNVK